MFLRVKETCEIRVAEVYIQGRAELETSCLEAFPLLAKSMLNVIMYQCSAVASLLL